MRLAALQHLQWHASRDSQQQLKRREENTVRCMCDQSFIANIECKCSSHGRGWYSCFRCLGSQAIAIIIRISFLSCVCIHWGHISMRLYYLLLFSVTCAHGWWRHVQVQCQTSTRYISLHFTPLPYAIHSTHIYKKKCNAMHSMCTLSWSYTNMLRVYWIVKCFIKTAIETYNFHKFICDM